jgi:hypothetical protein
MDADSFRTNLAATITWCRARFAIDRPKESLRSDELCPPIIITASNELAPIHHAVASVIQRRASILGTSGFDDVKMGGRLLGFYVRQTVFDGVSEIETNGFLDDTNTPPWDTWVCMTDELLVAWVPPAMVDDVQSAIICNTEGCIAWLTDIDNVSFLAELRQQQLVW